MATRFKATGQAVNAMAVLKWSGTSRSRSARRHEARRRVLPGYPVEAPFACAADAREYLSADRIRCLRCGRELKVLGVHLLRIHGWTAAQYKEHYRLPLSPGHGLSCQPTRELYRASNQARAAVDALRPFWGANVPPRREPRSSYKAMAVGDCKRLREERICAECGRTFVTTPARPETHCSKSCARKAMHWPERLCAWCGRSFAPGSAWGRFCCPNHKAAARRKRMRSRTGAV